MATILIVDDRPTNRELLVTLLGYAGHHLLEATNGEEGLNVARAERPDLIITDIVMPKMDGYEFARQIRADASIGQTQIIFYTSSYIVNETRSLAAACGVSLVIGKPIEPEMFLETVKTALNHRQAPDAQPVPEDFHREHMRLLTDTLVNKVEDLEVEILERKQAETQLAEAHEFLEKILTSSPVGVITYRFTGECLSVNEFAAQIVGARVDQLRSQNFHEIESWKLSGLYGLAEKAIATRQQQKEDVHILTSFGKAVWFTAQFVVFQSGTEDCLLLTMSDITERKQAEQAVRESEKHYRQIIETAQEGVWAIDADNHTTLVNKRLADILGYTVEEMLGKTIFEFMDKEGQAIAAKSLENRRLGINEQLDFKYIRKDGGTVWAIIETSSLYDPAGNYAGALAMLTDITERKQAEETLRKNEERYRIIFGLTNDYAYEDRVEPDGRIIPEWITAGVTRITGHSLEEAHSPEFFGKLVHPDDLPILIEHTQRILSGQADTIEARLFTKSGELRWLRNSVYPVWDAAQGRVTIFYGAAQDITQEKQAEEQIRQRLSELEVLYESGLVLSQLINPKAIAKKMIDLLDQKMNWHHTAIRLYDPQSKTFELLTFSTSQLKSREERSAAEEQLNTLHGTEQGISGWVIQHGEVVNCRSLKDDLRYFQTFPGLQSGLYVPIKIGERVIGVISIESEQADAFSESDERLTMTLATQAAIAIDNALLLGDLQYSNTELSLAYDATIAGWSAALDLRDKETEGHSQRVTEMTLKLARAFKLSEGEMLHLRRGALLHDIGKMGVPDQVLLKPGALTDEEWVIMRKHPENAYKLLAPIAYLKPALDIPYCHHEKWDGTGYPRGLKGEEIPLAARLFTVVDVWDALRADRPYRAAWPEEKVREHIKSLSGTHFDPQVVKVFLESDITRHRK